MTKEEFLKLAAEKWDQIEQDHEHSENLFEYEKSFDELWIDFGNKALEGSLGKTTQDRRKKKSKK